MAIERLQGKPAGIDLATFFHEARDLVVEVQVAGKGLVAEFGKPRCTPSVTPGP